MSVDSIPADVILRVLICLSERHRFTLKGVSKHFQDSIDDILHNMANPILQNDLNLCGYDMLFGPLTNRRTFVGIDYIRWKGNKVQNGCQSKVFFPSFHHRFLCVQSPRPLTFSVHGSYLKYWPLFRTEIFTSQLEFW